MSCFSRLPEFEKELKRLSKKYPSLCEDLEKFETVIAVYPTGVGKNFSIIHSSDALKVVKARLACRSLRDRSIRIIYAYHDAVATFMHLELYFKGEKENEDYERVREYIQTYSQNVRPEGLEPPTFSV